LSFAFTYLLLGFDRLTFVCPLFTVFFSVRLKFSSRTSLLFVSYGPTCLSFSSRGQLIAHCTLLSESPLALYPLPPPATTALFSCCRFVWSRCVAVPTHGIFSVLFLFPPSCLAPFSASYTFMFVRVAPGTFTSNLCTVSIFYPPWLIVTPPSLRARGRFLSYRLHSWTPRTLRPDPTPWARLTISCLPPLPCEFVLFPATP